MNRKPGYILEITHGGSKGKYGIAYHSDQHVNLLEMGKLMVHLHHDIECENPVIQDGKPYRTLKSKDSVKIVGYVD